MAEKYSFFDAVEVEPNVYDREYNAQEFTDYFSGLIETGIMKDFGEQFELSNTGDNMVTTIGTGRAYIQGRYYENDSPLELTHDTESIGLNRIDRIVIRLDLNTNARHVKAFIKKGTPATNPVAPSLTRDDLVYEISLGQVRITGGQTFVPSNAITREVGHAEFCPYATSKILPNYDDDTLQAVLAQVQQANDNLDGHMLNPVIHTFYGTATGTNAKSITLNPAPTSLVDGMAVVFKNATANTSAVTLNVNGLGAKPIRKSNGENLSNNDLSANGIYTVRYNASTGAFILQGEGGYRLKPGDTAVVSTPAMNVDSTTYVNVTGTKEFRTPGKYRISFILIGGTRVVITGQLYVNGVAFSDEISVSGRSIIYTEDIEFEIGDTFCVMCKVNSPTNSSSGPIFGGCTVGIDCTIIDV